MKKTLIAIFAIALVIGFSTIAKADSFDQSVPLSVTIPAQFGFTLTAYSHDFGTVNIGEGAETTISIFCRSNHGLAWKLALNADEFSSTCFSSFSFSSFSLLVFPLLGILLDLPFRDLAFLGGRY